MHGLDAGVSAAAAASACGRPRGVPSPGDTVAKGAGATMASTHDGRWLAPSLPGVRDLERPTLIQQLRLSTLGCVVAVLHRRRLEMAATMIGMAKKKTRAFSAGQERHVQCESIFYSTGGKTLHGIGSKLGVGDIGKWFLISLQASRPCPRRPRSRRSHLYLLCLYHFREGQKGAHKVLQVDYANSSKPE